MYIFLVYKFGLYMLIIITNTLLLSRRMLNSNILVSDFKTWYGGV